MRVPRIALLATLLAAPAAHAADTPIAGWPSCCSPGSSDYVLASVGDSVTISGDFSHPLAWTFNDFTVTNSGPRTFAFATAGTFSFYCTIHPSTMGGRVKVGDNQHATPDFSFAPAAPKTGQQVTFTYTGTSDPDGAIASYRWDLDGNGSYETATSVPSATRTYSSAATYAAKVAVVDDGHETSAPATHAVAVTAAPASQPGGGGPNTGGSGGGSTGGAGTTDGAGAGGAPTGGGPASGGPAGESPAGDGSPAAEQGGDRTAPTAVRPRVAGNRLRLTVAEAATLDGVLRRGAKRVRKLRAALKPGKAALRLAPRLRRGRYTVRFTLTDAAGNRSRAVVVTFRVR